MGLSKLKTETIINKCIMELVSNDDVSIRFAKVGDGSKVPVIISDDKVCSIINKKQFMQISKNIARPLYDEYNKAIGNPECFILTAAMSAQIFDTAEISQVLQLKDKIKPFCFLSEDVHTYCRLPFDPIVGASMPENWASFLSNFSNVEAICMWVGSLFHAASDRSQYLWIYGKGGNGKSTLARVVSGVLGPFVRFEQTPAKDDKYWTNGLLGKRLIVLDDCNNYGFVKTGLFKSLTGSSKVRVEAKYGNPYDADLDCKFLFTSNEAPMVSDDLADQRRIIFSSSINKEKFDYDPAFETNLKATLPEFISVCMGMYAAKCSDGRPIPTDDSEAMALAQIFDEEIEAWLESIGDFKEDSLTSVADFRRALHLTKLNPRHVYRFMENKGVTRAVGKTDDRKSFKVLKGFSIKVINGRF